MPTIEVIIFLLAVLVGLSVVVDRLNIPQPIMLVVAGLVIGFTPQLPDAALKPDTVFLIFLPPLLFTASWNLSWHDFKAERRPVISLATGLVFFTTIAVAAVAHYFIPGFSWELGFVLGAIISPTDAVAAISVTKVVKLPKRINTILEGESLLNDASALIAFRYAIASVVTGGFMFWHAGMEFLWISAGGILIGVAIGWLFSFGHKWIKDNAKLEVTLTLLTPYIAYLLAEHFHLSGVLAVVAAGFYLSFRSPEAFSFQTRMQANSFWGTIDFLLNGFVFILIGMQLPIIISDLQKGSLIGTIGYGCLITLVAVLVRIIWVFPGAYLPGLLSKKSRRNESIDWRYVAIISWTGMRGVVSLASALAVPLTLMNGKEFPQREMILFITFCVIFLTLVIQGLSLPLVIRLLKIKRDGKKEETEENETRVLLANQALDYIESNYENADEKVIKRLRYKYEVKLKLAGDKTIANSAARNIANSVFADYIKAQKDVLDFERSILIQMHKDGSALSDILKKIEYELDLEDSRLKEQMKKIK